MLTKFRVTFVVLSLLLPSALLADGLIFQLPEDGTWARFEFDTTTRDTTTRDTTTRDGKAVTMKGTMTVSSVGVVQVDGEACRWIELIMDLKHDGQPLKIIYKLLIPEKSLGKGADPLARIHKAWEKHPNGAGGLPREFPDPKGTGAQLVAFLSPYLHGPSKTMEQLPKVMVESKLGKLNCEGHKAHEKRDMLGNFVFDSTYTTRLHPSAPFGVVTYESMVKVQRNGKEIGQMTEKLKLVDFGKDAKSQLPDSK